MNQLVEQHGGNRLCEMGLTDAGKSDMFTDFDSWGESIFWPAVTSKFGSSQVAEETKSSSTLQVEVSSNRRASVLGLQLQEGYVVENKLLSAPGVPEKRMVRFKLPSDMTYQCGDYLAVLPVNPTSVVRRAISRLGLPWDAVLRIKKPSRTSNAPVSIPLDTPIGAFDVFSEYVELSQPASKRDLNVLANAAAGDEDVQAELRYLASSPSRFTEEIVNKRVSPLDLLTRYPTIKINVGDFLAMLPPMRVRQYSISSSPLANPSECTITFSVLNAPSLASSTDTATEEQARYLGVASTYLSLLQPGELAHISVRPSHHGFKPPSDLETPMIMACAGSGIAPFRGFVMERAEKIKGRLQHTQPLSTSTSASTPASISTDWKPAKAILYVGCRTKGQDDIHASEFEEWAKLGAVDVRWAYSRPSSTDPSTSGDVAKGQHIQDLMLSDREELVELFGQGARIYVCGSTGLGNAVREVCKRFYLEERMARLELAEGQGEEGEGQEDEEKAAEAWVDGLRARERYATDVFT